MDDTATFADVTKRIETMGKLALDLAKAREAAANARFTHAKASGVEFQVMAAYRFLRKVEQETRRLRRQAYEAKQQLKRMTKKWKSARVLFRGKRTKFYALRQAHLIDLLQQVMLETADQLYEVRIKKSSRHGPRNFLNNDVNTTAVPDVPDEVETGPGLLQFVLENRLIFKPLAPAMSDVAKMFKVVNDFHKAEAERLSKLVEQFSQGALDIWDDVPIFGRVVED